MNKEKTSIMRLIIPFIILVMLSILLITSAVALYVISSDKVNNTFTPAKPKLPTIQKTVGEDGTITDIKVSVGDTEYPVYVRAKYIITWQMTDGTVVFERPEQGVDKDYTLAMYSSKNWQTYTWTQGGESYFDDYYYYNKPLSKGGVTDVLIASFKSLKPNGSGPHDSTLKLQVIVQTVQAVGSLDENPNTLAWQDAWQGYLMN